ncbi:hypothetical protein VNI00_011298 [Paramarasmius palmivorus]|uniref:F-box domain-containing protein n=1 Tax=Paramarasmius palmivorus TaxID=297713 RepID=A0AAW0CEA2_9AGAR
MNLPPTTHDFIFRDLSAKDLLNYSKVNKAARTAVKAFYRRAFRVENVLSRYFDDDELRRFRILQFTTGCLISGSTALSFFERQVYPESDLDLYVDFRYAIFISDFLMSVGYVFEPFETERKQQAKDITSALEAMDHRLDRGGDENEALEGFGEYITSGILDVFSFVRDGKKIQIIATGHDPSPMDVILTFHSTVVMNIISYSHAISFFPKATFIDHISIVNHTTSHRAQHIAARAKYASRGWLIREDLDPVTVLDKNSEFGIGDRYIGDRHCWTVAIPPITDFAAWSWGLGQDWMLLSNSWNVRHEGCVEIGSKPFFIPPLTQSYAFCDWVLEEVKKEEAFKWEESDNEEMVGGKKLRLVDDRLSDFIEDLLEKPRPEENPLDAFIRNALLEAFKDQKRKYSHLDFKKQVSASQALRLSKILGFLAMGLSELPTLTFRFAQNPSGWVWTNVDFQLPPGYRITDLDVEVVEAAVALKQGWRINVDIMPSPYWSG